MNFTDKYVVIDSKSIIDLNYDEIIEKRPEDLRLSRNKKLALISFTGNIPEFCIRNNYIEFKTREEILVILNTTEWNGVSKTDSDGKFSLYVYILIDSVILGDQLSELLYSIIKLYDGNHLNNKLFKTLPYLDKAVMLLPNDDGIVTITPDFQTTIDSIGKLLGPSAFLADEGKAMVAYLQAGPVLLKHIIPSQLPSITNEEFEAYFKQSDINGTIN